MATKSINTAKVYALTSAGACSITLIQGDKTVTWEALSEGGQTSVIVPAGATVEISDNTAILSPLPENFKTAPGASNRGIGGTSSTKGDSLRKIEGATPELTFQNATWNILSETATSCCVLPARFEQRVLTMQLLVTPTSVEQLSQGWLTVPEGVELIWPFGEAVLAAPSHTYVVTLLQLSPIKIIATLATAFAS